MLLTIMNVDLLTFCYLLRLVWYKAKYLGHPERIELTDNGSPAYLANRYVFQDALLSDRLDSIDNLYSISSSVQLDEYGLLYTDLHISQCMH